MLNKLWTLEEIEWLKLNYPKFGKKYCIKYLNKTESSIRGKASKLHLKQDRSSDFFKDWQNRAALSKVGKKRPEQAKLMREYALSYRVLKNRRIGKHHLCKTRAYIIWNGIMNRCYNKNCKGYKNYGGRGIEVYKEWHDVKIFSKWYNKNSIENLSIDRINVNGNYEPNNCRFVNQKEQARNTTKNVLNYELVKKIRDLYKEGYGQSEIGRMINLSNKVVHAVVKNQIWA